MSEEEYYYYTYIVDMIGEIQLQLLETQGNCLYNDNNDDLPF